MDGEKRFIGEIKHLFLPQEALQVDGNVDLTIVNDVCTTGLYTYNVVNNLATFPYAKANNIPDFTKNN